MKKLIFVLLIFVATISIVCFAGPIYDDARQAGIAQFNRGNYSVAVKQFIALQNIAPVNNDLSVWIIRCRQRMVQSRNMKIKNVKKTRTRSNRISTSMLDGVKIQQYDSIGNFGTSGLALVELNKSYGFINRDSIIVIPIQYDDIYSIITDAVPGTTYDKFIKTHNLKWNWSWGKGALMSVCKDGRWGYINESGKEIIPIIYDDVNEPIVYSERYLIGVGNGGKYGFVDRVGNLKIPLQYDYVSRFYNGGSGDMNDLGYDMVPVVRNGKMGFIDNNGRTVIAFEYEPQYNIEYNVPVMYRPVWFNGFTDLKKNGKFGMVDLKGNSITGFKYDERANVDFINIAGKYKTYFEFNIGDGKAYFMDGKEYDSETEFNQAVTKKSLSLNQSRSSMTFRFVDTNQQAKDPDYDRLKLMKEELAYLENCHQIEMFNYFSEGVAVVELNDAICLFYKNKPVKVINNTCINKKWTHYNSGLLGCCYPRKNGNAKSDGFYLDIEGNVAFNKLKIQRGKETVIGIEYGNKICGGPFKGGYADVWRYKGTKSKHGLIDVHGTLVVPCEYNIVYRVSNGYVAHKGYNIIFLDNDLNILDKIKYASPIFMSPKEFIIKVYGEGYRRYSGAFACTEISNNILFLPNRENLHVTSLYGGKYGYCDNSGNIVIPLLYDNAKPFSDGLAAVCIDNQYGFIDVTGNLVISNMFDDAGSFNDGVAWVKKNGSFFYIDKTGKLINNDKYTYADDFHEGFCIVRKGNHYGILARSGLSTFDIK